MKKIIVFITFLLLLSGCNSVASSKYYETVAGTYKVVAARSKDKTYTPEELEKIKEVFVLKLQSGGYAELSLEDGVHYITYNRKFLIVANSKREVEKIKYVYKNGKINIYYNGGVYTFVRV